MNNIRTKNLIVTTVVFVFSVMGVSAQKVESALVDGRPVINCAGMHTSVTTTTSKGQTQDLLKTAVANATVFHRFAVSNTNNDNNLSSWSGAFAICSNLGQGWRLPTQRELLLIWVLHGELMKTGVFDHLGSDFYHWSATEDPTIVRSSWNVRFVDGDTYVNTQDYRGHVRCIKELPKP